MRHVLAHLWVLAISGLLSGTAAADVTQAVARAKSGTFDATGAVRCAQEVGQFLGTCNARVARAGGSAAVVVTFPNGFRRMLMFSEKRFLRGNPTMSGVGTDTDWQQSGDIYIVRVDDQRFELPRALVDGDEAAR